MDDSTASNPTPSDGTPPSLAACLAQASLARGQARDPDFLPALAAAVARHRADPQATQLALELVGGVDIYTDGDGPWFFSEPDPECPDCKGRGVLLDSPEPVADPNEGTHSRLADGTLVESFIDGESYGSFRAPSCGCVCGPASELVIGNGAVAFSRFEDFHSWEDELEVRAVDSFRLSARATPAVTDLPVSQPTVTP